MRRKIQYWQSYRKNASYRGTQSTKTFAATNKEMIHKDHRKAALVHASKNVNTLVQGFYGIDFLPHQMAAYVSDVDGGNGRIWERIQGIKFQDKICLME